MRTSRSYARYSLPFLVIVPDLIQLMAQDYGVKANLKTEALIDLLLDASQ